MVSSVLSLFQTVMFPWVYSHWCGSRNPSVFQGIPGMSSSIWGETVTALPCLTTESVCSAQVRALLMIKLSTLSIEDPLILREHNSISPSSTITSLDLLRFRRRLLSWHQWGRPFQWSCTPQLFCQQTCRWCLIQNWLLSRFYAGSTARDSKHCLGVLQR